VKQKLTLDRRMFTSMSLVCADRVDYTDIMRLNSRSAEILPIVAAACLLVVVPSAAIAADSSAWDNDLESAARLIAARAQAAPGGRVFRAGVEIKLKPGWKTYWRYPGDSGVPPVLAFSQSENVKTVTVLYPAPMRFADGGGGSSIGYNGGVILPLHVVPQDAAKPVMLRLKLDYAACEKLCVPARAQLELALTGGDSTQEAAVGVAEARVPKATEIGGREALSIRAVQREVGAGKPRVVVDVAAPAGAEVALFAEGPTAEWALPLPEPVAGAPAGLQRFAFALDGLPSGAKPDGAVLRLTAVAGEKAIEAAFRLD
jgi:DsbC/DsbD-like thiol-disulfide interchange protein